MFPLKFRFGTFKLGAGVAAEPGRCEVPSDDGPPIL